MQHAKQISAQVGRSNSGFREELQKRYNVTVSLPQIKSRRNSIESALENKAKYKNSFKFETKQMLNTGVIKTRSKSAFDEYQQPYNTEISNNKYDLETAMELALRQSDAIISKIRTDYQECSNQGQKQIKQLVIIQQRLLAEESYRRSLKTVTSIQQLKTLHQMHQRKADQLNYLSVQDILFNKHSNGEMVNVADVLPVYEIKINNALMELNDLLEEENLTKIVAFNQITDLENLDFNFEQSLKQLIAFFSPNHQIIQVVIKLYRLYNGIRSIHPLPPQANYFTINKRYVLTRENCKDKEILTEIFKNYDKLDESQLNSVHNLIAYIVQTNHTMCIHNIPLQPIRDVINNFSHFSSSISNSSIENRVKNFVKQTNENKREVQEVERTSFGATNTRFSENIKNSLTDEDNQLNQSKENDYAKLSELNVAGSKSSVSDPLNKRMQFDNVKFSGNTDLFNSASGSGIDDVKASDEYKTVVQLTQKEPQNEEIEQVKYNTAYNAINEGIKDKDANSAHSSDGFDDGSGSAGFDDQSDDEKEPENKINAYGIIADNKKDDDFD